MGGHVEACTDCGHWRIAYNSCRPARILRQHGASRRAAGLPPPSVTSPQGALGGLRQAAVGRTRGGSSPICRATPTGSPSRTAGSCGSTRPESPSATRTIAAAIPTA